MPIAVGPLNPTPERIEADVGSSGSQSSVQRSNAADGVPFAQKLSIETKRQVQPTRTPLTPETARSAIASAYRELVGAPLSESGSAILTAHWAHETGHGASMFNFNFGGIKGVGPSGLTVAQKTREGFGSTERQIVDNFRAYGSIDEGAKDYVKLLLTRYGSAVASADRGDAAGFVRGLKDKGYFTGDPAAYERNVVAIANRVSGATGAERMIATQIPTALPSALASPVVNTRPTSVRADPRLAALTNTHQSTLTPTALLEVAGVFSDSNATVDGMAELSATRALAMADEIARAALRIAVSDRDDIAARGSKSTPTAPRS